MLERMKEMIADQLSVEAEIITEASSFKMTWEQIPWIFLN